MDNQVQFPFAAGSETSKAAAQRLRPGRAEIDRAMMLSFIKRFVREQRSEGPHDGEIQAGLGMSGDTERPRRNELAGHGRITSKRLFWPVLIVEGGRHEGRVTWVPANG